MDPQVPAWTPLTHWVQMPNGYGDGFTWWEMVGEWEGEGEGEGEDERFEGEGEGEEGEGEGEEGEEEEAVTTTTTTNTTTAALYSPLLGLGPATLLNTLFGVFYSFGVIFDVKQFKLGRK